MLQNRADMSHAQAATEPPGSTEDRILDATLAVLARTGRQLSMSDVAQTAGVSRMTLYRHHASKEALLLALARHEQRRFDEQLAGALAGVTDPAAQVDAVLRAIGAHLDASAARGVVAAEPGFIIDRMRQSLPVQRASIVRLIGAALAELPSVRAGRTTPAELADLILRVAMSEFLLPAPDPDAGLRALRALVTPPEVTP
jgi:TetR/AcrR family transcriptional regulator, repressor for uid operon